MDIEKVNDDVHDDARYWRTLADQTLLTGDKSGSFDLTTTGIGTFNNIVETVPTLLKLDQTTPQSIENGEPTYETLGGASISNILAATKEPTGFPNRTDSVWSFTGDTLTIAPVVTSYDIWFDGVKHTISATKTLPIADTEGTHLIYFDTDDTLKEYVNPTVSQVLTAIRDKCLVALIYWDATNNTAVYVGEERHGTVMDGITHYYLHYTRGLQYVSGLGLGDFVIGNGSLDTHAQFSVEEGSVSDEDIGLSISAVGSTTGLPILYRLGATGAWRGLTQAGFSCYQNPSGTTHRLMYNQWTGATWQLTEIGEANYVLMHIYATTGKTQQIYAIMGQAEYATVGNARTGAQVEISSLQIGSLPSVEMRPIATVIFQTDKDYGNSINARVIEVDGTGTDDYVDWRTNDLPRGTVAGDHGSLTGLGDDDHTQYHLTNGSRTGTGTHTFGEIIDSGLTASKVVFSSASKQLTSTGIGTSAQFIKGDGSLDSSTYLTSVTAHDLLSATHGDTTASTVARGDLIVGMGATPKWDNLAIGTTGKVLTSDGTDISWQTPSGGGGSPGGADTNVQFNDATAFGGTANFTYGKTTQLLKVIGDGGSVALSIGDPADTGTAVQTIGDDGAFNALGYSFSFNIYACQNKGGQISVYSATPENILLTDDGYGFDEPSSGSDNWYYDASANYDWNDMPYLSGGGAVESGSGSYMTSDSPVYTIYSYRTIRGTLYYCTAGEVTSANPTSGNDNVAFDVSWSDPSNSTIEGYKILCAFGGNTVSTTCNGSTFTVNDPGNWSGDATVTPTVTQVADAPYYKFYAYKNIGGTTYYSKTPYQYNASSAWIGMAYISLNWSGSWIGYPDGYRVVCTFGGSDKYRDVFGTSTTDYGTNDGNWSSGTPTLAPNYRYNVTLDWDAVSGADFYRVSLTDSKNGYTDNYYIETTDTSLVYDGTTGVSAYHPDATSYPGYSASKTIEDDSVYFKGGVRGAGGFSFDSGDVNYTNLAFVTPKGNGVKCYWNPAKAAFRAGAFYDHADDANVGDGSVAFGINTKASGQNSFALGSNSVANALYGIAMGNGSKAGNSSSDNSSVAIGGNAQATSNGSVSIGNAGNASASYAVVIGTGRASATRASSIGGGYASGSESVYIGYYGDAKGAQSVAIGYYPVTATTATGGIALGSGTNTTPANTCYVSSPYGIALGYKTHAEGGSYVTSIGKGCINYLGTSVALGNDRINELIHGDTVNIIDSSTVGTEKLTNGTFTGAATGWTLASGWTYNTNLVRKDGNGTGTISQTSAAMATPLVVGEVYQLQFTISSVTVTSSTLIPACGGVTLDTIPLEATTYTRYFKATSTADLTFTPSNTARFYIDTVSLKKITGGNLYVAKDFKVDGSSTLGSASTDTVTAVGRFLPRTVASDPTANATAGTRGEIVYYNDKWYGKTVDTATNTNWSALN